MTEVKKGGRITSKEIDCATSTKISDKDMEGTRGIWLRQNYKTDELEIWYDGVLNVTWDDATAILPRLTALLREAVTIGEHKAKADIRRLLGCR